MRGFVGAIDQGTTSTRFLIFDRKGGIVGSAQKEHEQIYPKPGWVEHNATEIWRNTVSTMADALASAGLSTSDLVSVGVTNQRETTLLWDRSTGEPLSNAIVWQDTRTDRFVTELGKDGGQDRLRGKTGLPLATYFSGLKLHWLLENIPGANGTGAFAVATVNVGATGAITASADTGATSLPLTVSLCETNPATGQCISGIGSTVTTTINANATPTFGIFVQANGNVPFDPALNRVFVGFKDGGNVTRGSTSVAVRTQ